MKNMTTRTALVLGFLVAVPAVATETAPQTWSGWLTNGVTSGYNTVAGAVSACIPSNTYARVGLSVATVAGVAALYAYRDNVKKVAKFVARKVNQNKWYLLGGTALVGAGYYFGLGSKIAALATSMKNYFSKAAPVSPAPTTK